MVPPRVAGGRHGFVRRLYEVCVGPAGFVKSVDEDHRVGLRPEAAAAAATSGGERGREPEAAPADLARPAGRTQCGSSPNGDRRRAQVHRDRVRRHGRRCARRPARRRRPAHLPVGVGVSAGRRAGLARDVFRDGRCAAPRRQHGRGGDRRGERDAVAPDRRRRVHALRAEHAPWPPLRRVGDLLGLRPLRTADDSGTVRAGGRECLRAARGDAGGARRLL